MKPYSITFNIETREEHDELYAIFNYTNLIRALPNLLKDHKEVRRQLQKESGLGSVSALSLHNKLKESILHDLPTR